MPHGCYDKRKVVCLTVALPHAIHYALKDLCERIGNEEMRRVRQADIARLAIVRFMMSKGVKVQFELRPRRAV